MIPDPIELLTPRILVVDDERQIHASMRLRLYRQYELVYAFDAREALEKIRKERFDLCFTDIHMPNVNGLAFIESARGIDPELGFVVVSAFDTGENLRRAIPLGVYEFLTKPLPERDGFEARVPEWIARTRLRRREQQLAAASDTIANDRDSALLEREVELVASESARDALVETASLMTTIQAHLVSVTTQLAARSRHDPWLMGLLRNLEEARKTTDAAMTAAGGFFDSAYGSRDSSPALINEGIRHAISIARRLSRADSTNKAVDFAPLDERLPVKGLTGIDFLLLAVPAIGAALALASPDTTVGVGSEYLARLDLVFKDPRFRSCLWINRRHAVGSQTGVLLTVSASARPLSRAQIEAWVKNEYAPLAPIPHRGLISGIGKCRGILGMTSTPESDSFRLVLALPT